MDTNGDGKLSRDEFKTALESYHQQQLPQQDVEDLFKRIDQDENGFIDYAEFVTAALDIQVLLGKNKLRGVFNKLDKDKSGAIDVNEIKEMFKYHNMTDKSIECIMKNYDKNGDGELQYDEFEDMMIKGFQKKKTLGKRAAPQMV